jgi:hypothetical protein
MCKLFFAGLVLAAAGTTYAAPVVVSVFGNDNPFLAGQPDGTNCCSGDSAPDESPTLVTGLTLIPGQMLTFSVTGWVSHVGATTDPGVGPDGSTMFTSGPWGTGIGGYTAPINALMGVFLDNSQPMDPAPASLNFNTIGTDFAMLAPGLRQIFFIGDGEANGMAQHFVIPTGATRLYLGSSDGFGWYNNSGTFRVTIDYASAAIPEPSTDLLAVAGLLGVAAARRFRS